MRHLVKLVQSYHGIFLVDAVAIDKLLVVEGALAVKGLVAAVTFVSDGMGPAVLTV
jgi:hypothetical protein